MSVMLLSDDDNERLFAVMEVVMKYALQFQTDHHMEHKSSEECRKYMQSLACGGYLQHLADIVSIITDSVALERCGFAVNPVQVNSILQRASDGEVQSEDDFSHVLGQLVFEFFFIKGGQGLAYHEGLALVLDEVLPEQHHV